MGIPDMSNTKELERLYYALGDFIFKYFQHRCVVPGTTVSIEFVNMVRDASLNSFNDIIKQLDKMFDEGKA